MTIFKTSIIGYNKKQVRKYMRSQAKNDQVIMEKQKQRIYLLREDNAQLNMKLNGYKHRERAILSAMIDSRDYAERILIQSREKAIKELQALKHDIGYIKSLDNLTPYQLALAIDKTCTIIAENINEIRQSNQ